MLQVDRVSLSYPNAGRPALDRVSLTVRSGEIMALLGPSGSGKTSLLRVITGLERPASGRVELEGRDLAEIPVHRRRIGLMFQEYALFPHMTVSENAAFGLRMEGREAAAVRRRVEEVLSWVEMEDLADREVDSLSGGERQRAALARSLAPEPALLLLDEPVGALDRALRSRLIPDLSALLRRVGVSAVYVTHDQDEAFAIADRVAVMAAGRIRQTDAPRRLWEAPADRWVARFLGLENMERITVRDGSAQGGIGTFPLDWPDGEYPVVIRPEGVRLDPDGPVAGEVETAVFTAGRTRLTVSCRGRPLAFDAIGPAPAAGEKVRLSIGPEAVRAVAEDGENPTGGDGP